MARDRYINVDKVIKALDQELECEMPYKTRCELNRFKLYLEKIPYDEYTEERTSKWTFDIDKGYMCENCKTSKLSMSSYCPDCGALMKNGRDDSEE